MCSSFLPWQGKLWVLAEGGGSTRDCRKFLKTFPPWCSYPNPHFGFQSYENRIRRDSSSPLIQGLGEALVEDTFWLELKDSLHLPLTYLTIYLPLQARVMCLLIALDHRVQELSSPSPPFPPQNVLSELKMKLLPVLWRS